MTMLTKEEWLKNIIGAVQHIASEAYQQDAWLGGSTAISSPTEIYCELFDDFSFKLYFAEYGGSFTNEQRTVWLGLNEALERYSETMEESPKPQLVLADPSWKAVRDAASDFLRLFG